MQADLHIVKREMERGRGDEGRSRRALWVDAMSQRHLYECERGDQTAKGQIVAVRHIDGKRHRSESGVVEHIDGRQNV